MKNLFYTPKMRAYVDENGKRSIGLFIARGQWADGHLAYTRLDPHTLKEIEGEECAYAQIIENHSFLMVRV